VFVEGKAEARSVFDALHCVFGAACVCKHSNAGLRSNNHTSTWNLFRISTFWQVVAGVPDDHHIYHQQNQNFGLIFGYTNGFRHFALHAGLKTAQQAAPIHHDF